MPAAIEPKENNQVVCLESLFVMGRPQSSHRASRNCASFRRDAARSGSMRPMDLALVLVPVRGAHPVRLPLVKRLTTIGSDASADVRLPTAPPNWAVVHRGDGEVEIHV